MKIAEGDSPGEDLQRDPLVGKVLNGRFTVLEPIGTGGMGRVYKALQAPLDRLVALKVLNPSYAGNKDPGFQKRFFLEASHTSRLHHPNTITVHDYGRTDDGIYFIAMEYVEGQTLAQLIADEGGLPWDRVLHIGAQICRSLREAHRQGVVHRDLKPANIMVLTEATERDLVKVLDFGLVKPFLADAPKTEETELTQAGMLLGSPLYMAPEQARHRSDPRTDVYSLGVVLFQMLTGRPPFEGQESIDIIVRHIREKPPQVRSLRPEVPETVEALVAHCLEKDPDRRFQSMDELLEAMRGAATSAGVSGAWSDPRSGMLSRPAVAEDELSSEPAQRTQTYHSAAAAGKPPQSGSRRTLVLVGVGVASLAVGLAALLATSGAFERPESAPGSSEPPAPLGRPPEDPPLPTLEAPAAAGTRVRFLIDSTPSGAKVSLEGEELGPTPLAVELSAGADGVATAELSFSLDGYQPAYVSAVGGPPEVKVNPRLTRKKPTPAAQPRPQNPPPNGYKEDPYQ